MARFAPDERMIGVVRSTFLLPPLLLLAAGCATSAPPPPAPAVESPATMRAGVVVPPGKILVEFETLSCVCNLGDVEYALLEIDSVAALDWDIADNRVWLIFVDDRRPTDAELRRSVQYTPLKITRIARG